MLQLQENTSTFTKILWNLLIIDLFTSKWVSKHIATITHPDQVGSIPGKHSFFILSYVSSCILTSLRKFKLLFWNWMPTKCWTWYNGFIYLKSWGLDLWSMNFMNWIEIIYCITKSYDITNDVSSQLVRLYWGVRQG